MNIATKTVQHQVVAANNSHMIPPPSEDLKLVIQAEGNTKKTVTLELFFLNNAICIH